MNLEQYLSGQFIGIIMW